MNTSTRTHTRRTPTQSSPVRHARERAGLTREQLAVKAGLSCTTVYLAERAALISEATAAKIARALGVSARDLLEQPKVGAA